MGGAEMKTYIQWCSKIRGSCAIYGPDTLKKPTALTVMTKEETIAFVKEYMEVRKEQTIDGDLDFRNKEDVWNIAIEYVLFDIIPYLYGEALE